MVPAKNISLLFSDDKWRLISMRGILRRITAVISCNLRTYNISEAPLKSIPNLTGQKFNFFIALSCFKLTNTIK